MIIACTDELAALCAEHLRAEEALLAELMPMVRAIQAAFTEQGLDTLADAIAQHQQSGARIDEMTRKRLALRERLARLLAMPPAQVTLSRALERLPAATRVALEATAQRVRMLVDELVTINHWNAVHVRIYLGAWHGMLCGLTGTAAGSGRYGPAGRTEGGAYRSLLQIRG